MTSRLLACFLLMVALGACAAPQPRKMVIVPSASIEGDEEGCPGVTGYTMMMPDGATISINVTTNLGPQVEDADVGLGPQVTAE